MSSNVNSADRKPTVLWVGDSPTVPTGFAACTRAVCNHLHSLGWQVHVLGINEFGDPHPDYPYPIYPCWHPFEGGNDGLGAGRLPRLIASIKPDVVVILSDPWQIPGYLDHINRYFELKDGKRPDDFPKLVAWLAVDGLNQVTAPRLNDLTRVVVWTEFAAKELTRCGLKPKRWRNETLLEKESLECGYDTYKLGEVCQSPCIVPLGVDTSIFCPTDQAQARQLLFGDLNLPPAYFVVGYVGRNQPRKRLDLLLAYFSEWINSRRITDAYLFLHVAPTQDMGADLQALAHYHGLDAVNGNGKLIISEQPTHKGTNELDMPLVYSAMDLFVTTTQGEGWGLPLHESMACGVPVIAPDWSGLSTNGGWPTPGSMIRVDCNAVALTAPINSLAHTIGGIPSMPEMVRALDQVYNNWKEGNGLSNRLIEAGLKCAREFTWERSAKEMEKVLLEVLGRG